MKWDAFDFKYGCFTVRHTVTACTIDGKHQLVKKDKTKTKSSTKTYPLIPYIEEHLLEIKEKQDYYRQLCGNSYLKEYDGYVCVDEIGDLLKPGYITNAFPQLLKKHELRHIRFHDLRHSCASLLLANGISMRQIQIWLGHSTFSTTADIYAHLDFHAQIESGLVMDGMFERNQVAEPTGLAAINGFPTDCFIRIRQSLI